MGKVEGRHRGKGPRSSRPASLLKIATSPPLSSATALPHSLGPTPTPSWLLDLPVFLWIPVSGHWFLPSLSRLLSLSFL